MRKTYLKPAIEVTNFIAEDILTASSDLLNNILGSGSGTSESASDAGYTTQDSRLAVSGN